MPFMPQDSSSLPDTGSRCKHGIVGDCEVCIDDADMRAQAAKNSKNKRKTTAPSVCKKHRLVNCVRCQSAEWFEKRGRRMMIAVRGVPQKAKKKGQEAMSYPRGTRAYTVLKHGRTFGDYAIVPKVQIDAGWLVRLHELLRQCGTIPLLHGLAELLQTPLYGEDYQVESLAWPRGLDDHKELAALAEQLNKTCRELKRQHASRNKLKRLVKKVTA